MLLYVLFVAVLNLGLGFAVAAYLGRRHRLIAEAGGRWERDSDFRQPDWSAPPSEHVAAAEPDASTGPPCDQVVQPQLPIESGREKSPSETSVEDLRVVRSGTTGS